MIVSTPILLFDFNSDTDLSQWYMTNDNVMGGVSNASILLDDNGNGVFFWCCFYG
jgi:hypothetical protein